MRQFLVKLVSYNSMLLMLTGLCILVEGVQQIRIDVIFGRSVVYTSKSPRNTNRFAKKPADQTN